MNRLARLHFVLLVVVAAVWAMNAQACVECLVRGSCFVCGDATTGGAYCDHVSCQSCSYLGTCGGGSGCFLAATMVATPRGPIAIKDLLPGDLVYSRDEEGNIKSAPIVQTHLSESWSYLVINGNLKVTETHPFYVGGKWVNAGELRVGDVLTGQDGKAIIVSSIVPINKGVRVYNISVGEYSTFFAGGYFVHNKGPDLGG